jgi:hypothetical protein
MFVVKFLPLIAPVGYSSEAQPVLSPSTSAHDFPFTLRPLVIRQ